jgi:hypothetical protein
MKFVLNVRLCGILCANNCVKYCQQLQTQQEWKFFSFYPSNVSPNEDKIQNYIVSWTMKVKKDANAEYEIIIFMLCMDDLTFW